MVRSESLDDAIVAALDRGDHPVVAQLVVGNPAGGPDVSEALER